MLCKTCCIISCMYWTITTVGSKCVLYFCRLVGYVSRSTHGCGRSTTDRQFYYCNGRPIEHPRVSSICLYCLLAFSYFPCGFPYTLSLVCLSLPTSPLPFPSLPPLSLSPYFSPTSPSLSPYILPPSPPTSPSPSLYLPLTTAPSPLSLLLPYLPQNQK